MSSDRQTYTLALEIKEGSVDQGLIRNSRTGEWQDDPFFWYGITKIAWGGRFLYAVIEAKAKGRDRSGAQRDLWAARLNYAAAKLAKPGLLSAFTKNDVTGDLPSDDFSPDQSAITVSISNSYAQQLDREFEMDQLARQSFKYAVERLKAYADSPPSPDYSCEEITMFSFLRNSLAAGYLETMSSWYWEKMGGIERYMASLARRKNRNHDGYHAAQDYIRSNLSCFSPPYAWVDTPPTLSLTTMNDG